MAKGHTVEGSVLPGSSTTVTEVDRKKQRSAFGLHFGKRHTAAKIPAVHPPGSLGEFRWLTVPDHYHEAKCPADGCLEQAQARMTEKQGLFSTISFAGALPDNAAAVSTFQKLPTSAAASICATSSVSDWDLDIDQVLPDSTSNTIGTHSHPQPLHPKSGTVQHPAWSQANEDQQAAQPSRGFDRQAEQRTNEPGQPALHSPPANTRDQHRHAHRPPEALQQLGTSQQPEVSTPARTPLPAAAANSPTTFLNLRALRASSSASRRDGLVGSAPSETFVSGMMGSTQQATPQEHHNRQDPGNQDSLPRAVSGNPFATPIEAAASTPARRTASPERQRQLEQTYADLRQQMMIQGFAHPPGPGQAHTDHASNMAGLRPHRPDDTEAADSGPMQSFFPAGRHMHDRWQANAPTPQPAHDTLASSHTPGKAAAVQSKHAPEASMSQPQAMLHQRDDIATRNSAIQSAAKSPVHAAVHRHAEIDSARMHQVSTSRAACALKAMIFPSCMQKPGAAAV